MKNVNFTFRVILTFNLEENIKGKTIIIGGEGTKKALKYLIYLINPRINNISDMHCRHADI